MMIDPPPLGRSRSVLPVGVSGLPPLRVLLTPSLGRRLLPGLAYALPEDAEIRDADRHSAGERPALLVLSAEDVQNSTAALELVAQLVLPGRPILIGGHHDRNVLMRAINRFHVRHVLPEDASIDDLAHTLLEGHHGLVVDAAIPRAATDLASETTRLDDAIERLRSTQGQLLHAERLTTLGRITGGLIGALRHQMARLDAFESVVRAEAEHSEEIAGLVRAAFDGVRGISSLVDEVHAYAEQREVQPTLSLEPLDDLIRRLVAFARYDRLGRERTVVAELTSAARVRVDRHRLWQAVLNLLRNAFQASSAGSEVRVTTRGAAGGAVIEITDQGPGIPPHEVRQLFEPFYTTKAEGMGLGLHVTRLSIERLGGCIEVESSPGQGATFRIWLPTA